MSSTPLPAGAARPRAAWTDSPARVLADMDVDLSTDLAALQLVMGAGRRPRTGDHA